MSAIKPHIRFDKRHRTWIGRVGTIIVKDRTKDKVVKELKYLDGMVICPQH